MTPVFGTASCPAFVSRQATRRPPGMAASRSTGARSPTSFISVCALTVVVWWPWRTPARPTRTTASSLYVPAHCPPCSPQITLDATPELQNKHTIFGRVGGTTIYNALALSEVELSTTEPDRPVFPPKLHRIEVVHNPFPDIVPRITREERAAQQQARQAAAARKSEPERERRKQKKNTSLLSFGEEEEAPVSTGPRKPMSSHDLLDDKTLSKQAIPARASSAESTTRSSTEPPVRPAEHRALSPPGEPEKPAADARSSELEKLQAAVKRRAQMRELHLTIHQNVRTPRSVFC